MIPIMGISLWSILYQADTCCAPVNKPNSASTARMHKNFARKRSMMCDIQAVEVMVNLYQVAKLKKITL